MDTPHIVLVNWTRNCTVLGSGGRITVTEVSDMSNSIQYQAQLVFITLSSTDDSGMYTSIVSVSRISSYPYVTSALPSTKTANINVLGKDSIEVFVVLSV